MSLIQFCDLSFVISIWLQILYRSLFFFHLMYKKRKKEKKTKNKYMHIACVENIESDFLSVHFLCCVCLKVSTLVKSQTCTLIIKMKCMFLVFAWCFFFFPTIMASHHWDEMFLFCYIVYFAMSSRITLHQISHTLQLQFFLETINLIWKSFLCSKQTNKGSEVNL